MKNYDIANNIALELQGLSLLKDDTDFSEVVRLIEDELNLNTLADIDDDVEGEFERFDEEDL